MALLRQNVVCVCPCDKNKDESMDDLINDTQNGIEDIFGSDKELNEDKEELSKMYEHMNSLLDKFINGLKKYLDVDFDLNDHKSDMESYSFIHSEYGPVIDVVLKDTFVLEVSILDNKKIVSRIKNSRFIRYNTIRKLLYDFIKKLKDCKSPRLNYYTTAIDQLLVVIHNYLLKYIFKVIVLNLEDSDGYELDEEADKDSSNETEDDFTNVKICNCTGKCDCCN